jgi:hypothetical protein
MSILIDLLLFLSGFFVGLAVACIMTAASRINKCAGCKLATVLDNKYKAIDKAV